MKRVILFILVLSLLIGCSSSKKQSIPHEQNQYEITGKILPKKLQKVNFDTRQNKQTIDRSLVYTAYFRIASLKPDSVHQKLIDLASEYHGYILVSEIDRTIIRIESKYLQNAEEQIEYLGKILKKTITATDVTDDYTDLQVRLENAMKSRDRYLSLLDKATLIPDILKIEKELERLNQSIDYLQGRINKLSHQITFATITVETSPELKPGVVGSLFIGIYKGVKWLFVR